MPLCAQRIRRIYEKIDYRISRKAISMVSTISRYSQEAGRLREERASLKFKRPDTASGFLAVAMRMSSGAMQLESEARAYQNMEQNALTRMLTRDLLGEAALERQVSAGYYRKVGTSSAERIATAQLSIAAKDAIRTADVWKAEGHKDQAIKWLEKAAEMIGEMSPAQIKQNVGRLMSAVRKLKDRTRSYLS